MAVGVSREVLIVHGADVRALRRVVGEWRAAAAQLDEEGADALEVGGFGGANDRALVGSAFHVHDARHPLRMKRPQGSSTSTFGSPRKGYPELPMNSLTDVAPGD